MARGIDGYPSKPLPLDNSVIQVPVTHDTEQHLVLRYGDVFLSFLIRYTNTILTRIFLNWMSSVGKVE